MNSSSIASSIENVDGLEDALETLELLRAIFPLDGELMMDEPTANLVNHPSTDPNHRRAPSELTFKLQIIIPAGSTYLPQPIEFLYLGCALARLPPRLWLDRHPHLSHAEWQQLSDRIEQKRVVTTDALPDTLSLLSQMLPDWLNELRSFNMPPPVSQIPPTVNKLCTRAWFRFPSLSTKSKRTDLVQLASKYSMTGFVLAGKPAYLALEADSNRVNDIEEYWSEIKTVSWADIPPFQNKVSEVMRGTGVGRLFETMKEVTESMISHNARNGRSDRAEREEVAEWLRRLGVSDQTLSAVLSFSCL
ncbi:hypothetical protein CROQUDRAFT_664422 [Cronartium quercuum f. sp. fusiforme G11]|uniref:Small nuclear ribonucleoprotein Prp3 C-terminal domain-containing protein n=1 Tax=Cronartium quercuum f. sp. fusiforme G11 TaxID=708437 RepID=A0A9P6T700_9BASI|nr:hypothetical protein CROQUDRAFT_664422 [Cronartium quercuum f. sp. fusiforme G11]